MNATYAIAADLYTALGWPSVVPLPEGKKYPPEKGYTGDEGKMPTREEIAGWKRTHRNGNAALRLPDGVIGIDVDDYGSKAGAASLEALEAAWGPLPATWISSARPLPSGVRFFKIPVGRKLNDKPASSIEILQRHHRYACVAPSIHPDTGTAYRWIAPDGGECQNPPRPEDLPELPAEWLVGLSTAKPARVSANGTVGTTADRLTRSHAVDRALSAALTDLYGGRHDAALTGAMALARLTERGHPGAEDALGDLGCAFRHQVTADNSRTEASAIKEWDDIVAGAKAKVGTSSATIPMWEENGRSSTATNTAGVKAGGASTSEAVNYFTEQGGLIVERLAGAIQAEGNVTLGHDGRLYRFENGVYRGDGDTFAKVRVRELLGERAKRSHYDEVMTWLRARFVGITEIPPTQIINVANGILNWRTGELSEHSPEVPSAIQVPVRWNPDARCPSIERFLAEVLPGDALEFIYELIGYAAYPGNPLRQAVLLLGPGRNGKSVLLALIRHLLGAANVCAIPLQTLAENRFAAAELFGKLANISGDLDARAVQRTDLFKMATGGDPIPAERKYGQPFSFVPFALQLFSANEAPISSDQSRAWFDRWVIVPLEKRIAEEDVDPHLTAKLTTPAELEGLLVHAVQGLQRVMERGRFELPAAVQGAGARYRDRLDTARAFVTEECVLHLDAWVSRSVLYRAYQLWAKEGGRLPISAVNFNDHLRANHGEVISESVRRGVRGWAGLGLGAEEER